MKITDVTVSRYVEMVPPDSRHASGKEVQIVEVHTDAGILGRGFLTMVIPAEGSYGDLSASLIRRYLKPAVTGEVLPCSVIDEDGISLGRPVRLSRHGVESLVPFEMDAEEQAGWLAGSAEKSSGYSRWPLTNKSK